MKPILLIALFYAGLNAAILGAIGLSVGFSAAQRIHIVEEGVPAMPVEVYAVVEVIAVPTVALTVCAAGVSVVFADTLDVATGNATTLEISTNAAARRFMGASCCFHDSRERA